MTCVLSRDTLGVLAQLCGVCPEEPAVHSPGLLCACSELGRGRRGVVLARRGTSPPPMTCVLSRDTLGVLAQLCGVCPEEPAVHSPGLLCACSELGRGRRGVVLARRGTSPPPMTCVLSRDTLGVLAQLCGVCPEEPAVHSPGLLCACSELGRGRRGVVLARRGTSPPPMTCVLSRDTLGVLAQLCGVCPEEPAVHSPGLLCACSELGRGRRGVVLARRGTSPPPMTCVLSRDTLGVLAQLCGVCPEEPAVHSPGLLCACSELGRGRRGVVLARRGTSPPPMTCVLSRDTLGVLAQLCGVCPEEPAVHSPGLLCACSELGRGRRGVVLARRGTSPPPMTCVLSRDTLGVLAQLCGVCPEEPAVHSPGLLCACSELGRGRRGVVLARRGTSPPPMTCVLSRDTLGVLAQLCGVCPEEPAVHSPGLLCACSELGRGRRGVVLARRGTSPPPMTCVLSRDTLGVLAQLCGVCPEEPAVHSPGLLCACSELGRGRRGVVLARRGTSPPPMTCVLSRDTLGVLAQLCGVCPEEPAVHSPGLLCACSELGRGRRGVVLARRGTSPAAHDLCAVPRHARRARATVWGVSRGARGTLTGFAVCV
ncbi:unnamed protein product [Arctia plantaginis]|uniref:Uncharacterized protein n=1 Tax=Arctia plantaginis TaxID=874455 RepID=A0A8S0ZLS3_ARCPL|nr:unnamed protein product [Arctia plantaginis]